MPDFRIQPSFPVSSVIDAAQRNNQLQEQAREAGNKSLIEGLQSIGQIGETLYDHRKRVAQSLAAAHLLANTPEGKQLLGNNEVASSAAGGPVTQNQTAAYDPATGSVSPNKSSLDMKTLATALEGVAPKDLLSRVFPSNVGQDIFDAEGNLISHRTVQKGSTARVLPSPYSGRGNPQQTQYVDADGTPLIYNPKTGSYDRANVGGGVTPVTRKGDESAITDATLLANQIPTIKTMFDAYRTSKSPRLQSTPAGRLLDPSGKQAENSLKLAAFTFGGKNLTANEKDVVFGALFPSWTDDEQARQAKEQLLTNYMTGKIDLMQAANLLGPAGSKMRETLAKYQGQALPKGATPAPAPLAPAPTANPDLAHLSTKELMDLRAKMTAHKEPKKS